MNKKWINVDVDEVIHAALSEAADANDLSLRQYVRRILKQAASALQNES